MEVFNSFICGIVESLNYPIWTNYTSEKRTHWLFYQILHFINFRYTTIGHHFSTSYGRRATLFTIFFRLVWDLELGNYRLKITILKCLVNNSLKNKLIWFCNEKSIIFVPILPKLLFKNYIWYILLTFS